MNYNLKPYPEYKDTGVPWLGEIPAHWEQHRVKFLFQYKKELNSDSSNDNVLSLTLRGVVNNNPDDPEGLVPKSYTKYQVFERNDLVFKLIDLENFNTSRVGIVHEDGIMSPAYIRLVPDSNVIPRYFYHQFYDLYLRHVYNKLGEGVRSTLGPSDLLNLRLCFPPAFEQKQVSRFLDHYDRLIRRYIRAQRRLIELLEEQKQALIQRAVTRGLDPDAPLKDSGIEWLGEIPAHWGTCPLKFACKESALYGANIPATEYANDGIRFLRTTDIDDTGNLNPEGAVYVEPSLVQEYLLEDGELLLSRSGTIGRSFVLKGQEHGECAYAGYLVGFKLDKTLLLPQFAFYFTKTKSFQEWLSLSVISSTIGNVNGQKYANMPLPFPPLPEQCAIARFLDERTAHIKTTIDHAQRQINLIREYRTRLIADVVTGKLDVRGVPLPDPDLLDPKEKNND